MQSHKQIPGLLVHKSVSVVTIKMQTCPACRNSGLLNRLLPSLLTSHEDCCVFAAGGNEGWLKSRGFSPHINACREAAASCDAKQFQHPGLICRQFSWYYINCLQNEVSAYVSTLNVLAIQNDPVAPLWGGCHRRSKVKICIWTSHLDIKYAHLPFHSDALISYRETRSQTFAESWCSPCLIQRFTD